MQYLVPFDAIKRDLHLLAAQGTVRVNITYDEFTAVIRKLLGAITVDENWYRATYRDVAEGIKSGVHPSAGQHFVEHGYFEGRLPYPIEVDETWYLNTYPDVADGIRNGEHLSATEHFITNGYREGRQPSAASGQAAEEPSLVSRASGLHTTAPTSVSGPVT